MPSIGLFPCSSGLSGGHVATERGSPRGFRSAISRIDGGCGPCRFYVGFTALRQSLGNIDPLRKSTLPTSLFLDVELFGRQETVEFAHIDSPLAIHFSHPHVKNPELSDRHIYALSDGKVERRRKDIELAT